MRVRTGFCISPIPDHRVGEKTPSAAPEGQESGAEWKFVVMPEKFYESERFWAVVWWVCAVATFSVVGWVIIRTI